MIILFKNVFLLPLPVISKVRQYKETKTRSLDFILEVSKNVPRTPVDGEDDKRETTSLSSRRS